MTSDKLIAFAEATDGTLAINNYDLIDSLQTLVEQATNQFTVSAIELLIKWLSSCQPETFEHQGWIFTIFLDPSLTSSPDNDAKIDIQGIYFEDSGLFIYVEDLKKLLYVLVAQTSMILNNLDIIEEIDELNIFVASIMTYLDNVDSDVDYKL